MLQIQKHILVFATLFLLFSCEEVIDIELNTANAVIVAEGAIENKSPAWIQLNYTSDYFTTEASKKITDAQVILSDDAGNSETLLHTGNGLYKGSEMVGTQQQNYTLTVQISDKTYTATSYIHPISEVTAVQIEENNMQRPGHEASYKATITFNDQVGVNNHYLLKFTVNDELITESYTLVDDSFYPDNGSIEFSPMRLNLELNDKVSVQLYAIDKTTYVYYTQLNDQSGNPMGSSTPFNALSNFGDQVMGYFAAWSRTTYPFTVKEEKINK